MQRVPLFVVCVGLNSNEGVFLFQQILKLWNIHIFHHVDTVLLCDGNSAPCRLTKRCANGHDAIGCLRLVGRGDATSRNQQVVRLLGDQTAIGSR